MSIASHYLIALSQCASIAASARAKITQLTDTHPLHPEDSTRGSVSFWV